MLIAAACNLLGNNLFPDPGMEKESPAFSWNGIRVVLSRETVHSGKYALEAIGKDEKMVHATWRKSIPVKPNTVYTFSGWIKTDRVSARIGLFRHDENDKYIGHHNVWPPTVPAGSDWVRVQIVFNTEKAHYLRPTIGVQGTGKAWFDDFELREGNHSQGDNLLRNASFRQCGTVGYPDFWGLGPQCAMSVKDWENGNYYGISGTEQSPVAGTEVLYMKAPAASLLMAMMLPAANDIPLVFSVYLKSDKEKFRVFCYGKTVVASNQWERFEFPFTVRGNSSMTPQISHQESEGTLYLTAPKLEYGLKATPWNEPDIDRLQKRLQNVVAERGKDAKLVRVSEPPAIDGKLQDSAWKGAWRTEDFADNVSGQRGPRTVGMFACDGENLYLAFECHENAHVTPEREKGWGRFSGDSVEFFFCPGTENIYHVALNPLGEIYAEYGKSRAMGPWNPDIRRKTVRTGNGWYAEVAIPLSYIQPVENRNWHFNLCRNYRLKNSETLHLAAGGRNSYHDLNRFLQFGNAEMPVKKLELVNSSLMGESFFSLIRFAQPDNGEYSLSLEYDGLKKARKIHAGNSEVPVIFDGVIPASPESEISLTLYSAEKKKLLTFSRKALHLRAKNPGNALQIFAKYNWFSQKEKQIPVRIISTLSGKQDILVFLNHQLLRKFQCEDSGSINFSIPATLLADQHSLYAELHAGGKLQARAVETIRILPEPAGNTTRVNRFIRCLERNGKAVLPIIFHPVATRKTPAWIYSRLKQDHYNAVELILPPEMGRKTDFADIAHHLDDARDNGFPVIVRLNTRYLPADEKSYSSFQHFLELRRKFAAAALKYDNVLAFYLMDEPGEATWETKMNHKESDLNVYYKEIQKLNPYMPLTVNYCSYAPGQFPYGSFDCMDFFYFDCYPFHGVPRANPCEFFAETVAAINRDTAKFGMPVFFWLGSYGYGDVSRMPTPDELQNQIYTALIHGSRGIEYFIDYPVSVPLIRRVREIHKKLSAFSDILLDSQAEIVNGWDGFLHHATIRLRGMMYIMYANTSSSETVTLKHSGHELNLAPLSSGIFELRNGKMVEF